MNRQVRKRLQELEEKKIMEVLAEEETRQHIPKKKAPKYSFALLNATTTEEEEEEEEVVTRKNLSEVKPQDVQKVDNVSSIEVGESSSITQEGTGSKSKKRKKKKRKKRKSESESLPELEVLEPHPAYKLNELLRCDPNKFNASRELQWFRGSGSRGTVRRKNAHNKYRGLRKNMKMTSFKENWPDYRIASGGLFMETEEVRKNGETYFKFVYSKEYKETQRLFENWRNELVVQVMDQGLATYPWHIDTLLQMSNICSLRNEPAEAAELIERALYRLECSFQQKRPAFDITSPLTRLEWKHATNRSFFLAVVRHINNISRKACYHTAFNYAKLVLSLDRTDPMFMLMTLDYWALRACDWQFVLDFAQIFNENDEDTNFCLRNLPNWAFSVALAKFHIEDESLVVKSELPSMDLTDGFNSASECLLQAVLLWPECVLPILEVVADVSSEEWTPVLSNYYFKEGKLRMANDPTHKRVIQTIIDRGAESLWKDENIKSWLHRHCMRAIEIIESNPEVESIFNGYREEFIDSRPSQYRSMNSCEVSGRPIPAIPEDEAPQFNNHLPVGPLIQPGDVDLTNESSAMAFLRSFLPWVHHNPLADGDHKED